MSETKPDNDKPQQDESISSSETSARDDNNDDGQQSGEGSGYPDDTFVNPMETGDTSLKHDLSADENWPLEADRIAEKNALIGCLQLMAGHYGRRTSTNALVAGLPIRKGQVTPALFMRAARRADLNARLAEKKLDVIAVTRNFPCILVLEDQQACIIWDKTEAGDDTEFLVQYPETSDEKVPVKRDDLKEVYTGYVFYVRPVARTDDRAGPAEIDTAKDWFWAAIKDNMSIYKKVAIAAVIINVLALASPLFIMNVYDRVIPNAANESLWVLAVGVFIAFFFDFVLKNLRAFFLDHTGRRADVKISANLYEQLMGMTMAGRPSSAGVLASHMKEFEGLRDFFTSATMATVIDLPFILFFVGIMALIGGPIAFVPLAVIPTVIGCGLILQKPLERVTKQSMNESALKNAHLFESITGLETVKVQAAEGHSQRKWEELTEKASETNVKSRTIAAFALNFAVFMQQLASVLIVIVGYYMIQSDSYNFAMGALIACVILNGRALAPLAQVAGLLSRFSQSREALRHLDDLMQKPVERPSGKHYIPMPDIKGKVEFRDVVFKYPNQTIPAVNHLTLNIPAGEKVGIIGAVGSGKTTLARLMLNLYEPESGSVQIDGTDVRQIDPGDLRRNIGVVQQGAQLFYGTVRENITMGHETAPDSAVLRAAEISGVMDFLGGTETGLDTPVGERGEALSGGQRQAVAVARALLYDPPILIMDEPTASVDPGSENRMKARLQNLTEGRTVILITHKGAMLELVENLILMDKGRIVTIGPRDDVIRKLQGGQVRSAKKPEGRT